MLLMPRARAPLPGHSLCMLLMPRARAPLPGLSLCMLLVPRARAPLPGHSLCMLLMPRARAPLPGHSLGLTEPAGVARVRRCSTSACACCTPTSRRRGSARWLRRCSECCARRSWACGSSEQSPRSRCGAALCGCCAVLGSWAAGPAASRIRLSRQPPPSTHLRKCHTSHSHRRQPHY
jgi:hypothetical protein